jgi:hypothetical protein
MHGKSSVKLHTHATRSNPLGDHDLDTAAYIVHHVVRANLACGIDADLGSGDSVRVQFGTLGRTHRRIGYVMLKRACARAQCMVAMARVSDKWSL